MDILEQLKIAEEKSSSIEHTLQAAALALPDPIFIIDEFGKFLDVIGGQERSIFHRVDFLVGKYLHEILSESLSDRFTEAISGAISDNSLKIMQYQLGPGDFIGSAPEAPKGSQWFESRFYPIPKDRTQKLQSIILLSINITNRKNLERQLLEMADRDGLTGAYNRKYFMQIFDQEFLIARRYKTRLSVLLIDIDNFKAINNAFGLDGGDAILKSFTEFCTMKLRNSDLFARYSSEKFIIMLPNTPSIGAAILAERLRADIQEKPITYLNQEVEFSISIGASLVLDSDSNSIAVISRADAALYQAKKKGRNRVEIV